MVPNPLSQTRLMGKLSKVATKRKIHGMANLAQFQPVMKSAELTHVATTCANFLKYIHSLATKSKMSLCSSGWMWWIRCVKVFVDSISTTLRRWSGVKLTLKAHSSSQCSFTRIRRKTSLGLKLSMIMISEFTWTRRCWWQKVGNSSNSSWSFYRLTRARDVPKEVSYSTINTAQSTNFSSRYAKLS